MNDWRRPIEGSARFGLPYLKIAAVLALAAGILGAGYFGPHIGGTGTPEPTATLATAAAVAVTPSLSATIGGPAPSGIPGLAMLTPAPGQIGVSWLPGGITSSSMALIGRRLFYIVDGDKVESTTIGTGSAPQLVATAGQCQGINQLAAEGHEVAYLVTSPDGPTAQVSDCGADGTVSWSVWLADLSGGPAREVAHGSRTASTIDAAEFPVRLALSDSAYAFTRSADTVEVHSLDGRLLWQTGTTSPVAGLMLGGSTLALLTDSPAGTGRQFDLWVSDAARPAPAIVAGAVRSASLSPDGFSLAWDPANTGGSVATEATADAATGATTGATTGGRPRFVATPTTDAAAAPLRPGVWPVGSRTAVTWFATAPDRAIYPAVRYASGGAGLFIPSLQEPIWMEIQGGYLVWVAESAGGWARVAFAVELGATGLE